MGCSNNGKIQMCCDHTKRTASVPRKEFSKSNPHVQHRLNANFDRENRSRFHQRLIFLVIIHVSQCCLVTQIALVGSIWVPIQTKILWSQELKQKYLSRKRLKAWRIAWKMDKFCRRKLLTKKKEKKKWRKKLKKRTRKEKNAKKIQVAKTVRTKNSFRIERQPSIEQFTYTMIHNIANDSFQKRL